MKTAVSKIPASSAKAVSPFFSKEGGQGFFSPSGRQHDRNGGAFFARSGPIQTKLTIGQPGDVYEREADKVADTVVQKMSRPSPEDNVLRKPIFESNAEHKEEGIQRKCTACEKEKKLQKKERPGVSQSSPITIQRKPSPGGSNPAAITIQRKESPGTGQTADSHTEHQLNLSQGGGSALAPAVRAPMEQTMGADFSGVRVHTGPQADQMNQQLNAQAFTHKNDIYFGKGKFDTGSRGGQHLLAHELTHVVQQGGAAVKTFPAVANQDAGGQEAPAATPDVQETTPVVQPAPPQAAPPQTAATNPGAAGSPAPTAAANTTSAATPAAAAPTASAGPPTAAQSAPGAQSAAQTASGGPSAQTGAAATAAQSAPSAQTGAAAGPAESEPLSGPEMAPDEGVPALMGQIANAHDSEFKTAATTQAGILNNHVLVTQTAINTAATARTQEIHQWFADKRQTIDQFFIGTGQDVLNGIQQQQVQFMQMSTATMDRIRAYVTNIQQQVIDTGTKYSSQLSTFITALSSGVTETIDSIAGTITGFISSIPIPDLPGVGMIRDAIADLVNRAASAVRGVVTSITDFLQNSLTKATQIITDLVQTIGQSIQQLLDAVFEKIMQVQQYLFDAINRAGNMILDKMNGFLQENVYPTLQQGEDFMVGQVEQMRTESLQQIAHNQACALKAMANAVNPQQKSGQNKGKSKTSEERLLYFSQVRQKADQRDTEVLTKFVHDTSSFLPIAFHQVIATIQRIYDAVGNAIRDLREKINSLIDSAIQKVEDAVNKAIDKLTDMLAKMVEKFAAIVTKFITLVTGVKDAVVKLISGVVDSISSAISGMISRFISSIGSGGGSDSSAGGGNAAQSPATASAGAGAAAALPVQTLELEQLLEQQLEQLFRQAADLVPLAEEELALVGEEALLVEEGVVVVEEVVIVIEVVIEGWEVVLVIVIVILVILLIILLIYLLYLLYEYLTEPDEDDDCDDDDDTEDECKPDEKFDPGAPDGKTKPIKITWFKPLSVYEDPIVVGGDDYKMQEPKALPKPDDGEKIGVEGQFLPKVNKDIKMDTKNKGRSQQKRMIRVLKRHGYDWKDKSGARTSPDHVQDLLWAGPDAFKNLWPLESKYNEHAGSVQNSSQKIIFRPDPTRPCSVELPITTARKKYTDAYMDTLDYIIRDIKKL